VTCIVAETSPISILLSTAITFARTSETTGFSAALDNSVEENMPKQNAKAIVNGLIVRIDITCSELG